MYLVDTNVLSEARRGSSAAVHWLRAVDPSFVYLSAMTIAEIAKGIELKGRIDPMAATSLRHWLSGLETMYSDRILPVDTAVALAWGRLMAVRTRPVVDALIAATALVHRKIIVTRNAVDFTESGVSILDPWAG